MPEPKPIKSVYRTSWDHIMGVPSKTLRLWSVDHEVSALVIAETPIEARKIVDRLLDNERPVEAVVEQMDSEALITLHWDDEHDPGWSDNAVDWSRNGDGGMAPVTRRGQEWIDHLGKGMLAVEEESGTRRNGIYFRSSWDESRVILTQGDKVDATLRAAGLDPDVVYQAATR